LFTFQLLIKHKIKKQFLEIFSQKFSHFSLNFYKIFYFFRNFSGIFLTFYFQEFLEILKKRIIFFDLATLSNTYVCEYVENTIPAGVHVCTHRCKKFTRYRHNRDTNSVRAVTERLSDRTAQWQNESLPNWRKEQDRDEEERSNFLCVVNCLHRYCVFR